MAAITSTEHRQPLQGNGPLPPFNTLESSLARQDIPPHQQQPDTRDSGAWSVPQSKHSSIMSNNTSCNLHSILNTEDAPARISNPNTPSSARFPPLQVGMHPSYNETWSLTSWKPTNLLPSINQGFENINRQSVDYTPHLDSRRSSVDSRMNTGMAQMAIGPTSPYESQNASQASLVSNLQQQRGINTQIQPRPNGLGPLSPLGNRLRPRTSQPAPRIAPPINPNPRNVSGMPDPMAPLPTKGYAWAFPGQADPEDHGRSSSDESSIRQSIPSRQNSFAASISSSIYTTDSQLPHGQKRFDEGTEATFHSLTLAPILEWPEDLEIRSYTEVTWGTQTLPAGQLPLPAFDPVAAAKQSLGAFPAMAAPAAILEPNPVSTESVPPAHPGSEYTLPGEFYISPYTDPIWAPADHSTVNTTHHHSLQHKTITNLQDANGAAGTGSGNYSRTPELRVSHKLAERKRRSEMKGLFDELNSILPNSPGSKSSKWETLTKAIDHIRNLSKAIDMERNECNRLRHEAVTARESEMKVNLLRNEIIAMREHLRRVEPNTPHIFGEWTAHLSQQENNAPAAMSTILPPINPPAPAQHWPASGSSQMEGITYGAPYNRN